MARATTVVGRAAHRSTVLPRKDGQQRADEDRGDGLAEVAGGAVEGQHEAASLGVSLGEDAEGGRVPQGAGGRGEAQGDQDQEVGGRDADDEVAQGHEGQAGAEEEASQVLEAVDHHAAAHAEDAAAALPDGVEEADLDGGEAKGGVDLGDDDQEAALVHVLDAVAADEGGGDDGVGAAALGRVAGGRGLLAGQGSSGRRGLEGARPWHPIALGGGRQGPSSSSSSASGAGMRRAAQNRRGWGSGSRKPATARLQASTAKREKPGT